MILARIKRPFTFLHTQQAEFHEIFIPDLKIYNLVNNLWVRKRHYDKQDSAV